MDEEREELRQTIRGLVRAHGGQRAFAKQIGLNQASISRFLANGILTPKIAKRIAATYPGLKSKVDALFFATDMRAEHSVDAYPERKAEPAETTTAA